jgi:hypothetical protein
MKLAANHLVFGIDDAYHQMVRNFLACHPEHHEDLEQIAVAWPNLESILRRTAFFVSPAFPAANRTDHSLLVRALRNGVVAGLRHQGDNSYRPFLLGFLDAIAEVLATSTIYGLTMDGDEDRWELCDQPLCQWAATVDHVVFTATSPSPEELQASSLLLWARVLSVADLALLIADHAEKTPQLSLPLGLMDFSLGRIRDSFSNR